MTIREDNRLYEASDSGLESDRSQASYKQRTSCSPPYHLTIPGKHKQGSESLKERDENLGWFDFGERCDGCESDSTNGYKPKNLHSKTSNEPKVNVGQSPRRIKDGHYVQDRDSTHHNKSNHRSQRSGFHLPKIV